MTIAIVEDWLRSIGMERYIDAFKLHEIDWDNAQQLDHELLREIGVVAVGARLKILGALRDRTTSTQPVSAAPASAPDAEHRQLTVMFCDLVGSTELSVKLDLEDYRDLLGTYQHECAAAIERFHGYIARYMGDGLLVYFGYPLAHEDDAERALHAALDIVERLSVIGPVHGCDVSVRIGIATGLVVAGDIVGEGASEEHAILGETPSLAARLQSLAEPGAIYVATATRALAGTRFVCEDAGQHHLKGFKTPIQAWRVREHERGGTRFEAHRRPERTALVGRELELALLNSRWRSASHGDGQVVALSGDAGIGKSRLVHALRECIDDEEYELVQLQCSAHHQSSAFFPFTEFLARVCRIDVEQAPATQRARLRGWLAQHPAADAATLGLLLGIGQGAENEDNVEHRETYVDALVELLLARAIRQPILLVVEDLQWADPSTLDTLTRLLDKLTDRALLLLATYRAEFDLPWRATGHVTLQSLPKLGRTDAAELARSMSGAMTLSPEALAEITMRTDGVPLFVEELTRAILESRTNAHSPEAPAQPVAVPPTLQDSLAARLDRLGTARRTAQIAAVIGREFAYALLLSLAKMQESALAASLEHLVDAGIVEPIHDTTSAGLSYAFTHALVRDAAYSSLLRRDRQTLHGAIAEILEHQFKASARQLPEIVAHHFAQAGQAGPALTWWWQAAERALQRSALRERLSHLEQALSVARGQADESQRRQWLMRLELARGGALMGVEGYQSAHTAAAFEAARDLALNQDAPGSLFASLRGLHGVYFARAELDQALAAATQCLDMANASGNGEQIALAERLVGQTQFARGDLDIAMSHLDRATISDSVHTSGTALTGGGRHLMAGVFRAHTLWLQGLPDTALAIAQHGLEQAEKHFGAFAVSTHAYFMCWILGWRGDFAALSTLTSRVRSLASHHQLFSWVDDTSLMTHWPQLASAAPEDAAALALALVEPVRAKRGITTPHQLGILASYILALEPRQAAGLVEEALGQSVSGEQWSQAELLRIKAELQSTTSGTPATEQFRAARNLARAQGALGWERRIAISEARTLLTHGSYTAARAVLEPLRNAWREGSETQDFIDFGALLTRLDPAPE